MFVVVANEQKNADTSAHFHKIEYLQVQRL